MALFPISIRKSVFFVTLIIAILLSKPVAKCLEPEVETIQRYPVLEKAAELMKQGNISGAKSVYAAYLQYLLKTHPELASPLRNTSKKEDRTPLIESWLGLAHIAKREFDFKAARQDLEEALDLAPGSGRLYSELGLLYDYWWKNPYNGDLKYKSLAELNFRKAEQLSPEDYSVLTALGLWTLDAGDRVSAERLIEKAIELKPDYVPAFQNLARFYMAVEDDKRARETMLHAIEIDPNDADNFFIMAQLLANAEHPDKALENALKSERMDPGQNPDRDMLIARMYEMLGKLNEATAYYEKVSVIAPRYAEVNLKLAELYDRTKQSGNGSPSDSSAPIENSAMLEDMAAQAANSMRADQTTEGRSRLRKLYKLTANASADTLPIRQEIADAFSASYYSDYLNKQVNTEEITDDLSHIGRLFDDPALNQNALLQMDRIKLEIARQGGINHESANQLRQLADNNDPLASGEALFLLGEYYQAQQKLDNFEGQTAQSYLVAADRLMLEREFVAAKVLYERGKELSKSEVKNQALAGQIQQGLDRIHTRSARAEQTIQDGNQLYDQKEYAEALRRYHSAADLYPESDGVYLRLGDTYEKTGDRANAFLYYTRAIKLNPSLLNASTFKKKYTRLEKLYAKPKP